MPTKFIVTVAENPASLGTLSWDVKEAGTRNVICARHGFKTLAEAQAEFEEFKRDVCKDPVRTIAKKIEAN